MDTRKIAAEYRLSYWAQFVREQQESGLSIKAFCENAELHPNVYYYWQRKLREAACAQIVQPGGLTPSGFAEVKLMEEPTPSPAKAAPQLQIEVAGMRITAERAYPADELAALLRELVRIC